MIIILWILILFHFLYYIVKIKQKTGFIIDFWTYALIVLNIFFSVLFFPLAKAVDNEISTGGAQSNIANHVDQAFLIFSCGYIFMWIGKYLYSIFNTDKDSNKVNLWLLAILVYRIFRSKQLTIYLFIFFIPFFLYIAYQDFLVKNIFDVRSVLGESSTDRPIYNVAASMYPVLLGFLGVKYLSYSKKMTLFYFLLMLSFSFIFSSRSIAFIALSQYLFIYITKSHNIGWLKILSISLGLATVVIIFGLLREGVNNVNNADIFESLLYGNTFSDLRDFSWVLSFWDNQLLLGKTYLAAIISFIPSGFSDFRTMWVIGKVTTNITGLTGAFHGGLRITIFGESYINFGIFGVIFFATLFGYLLESINKKVMKLIKLKRYIEAYAMMTMIIVIMSMMITSSFFSIYVIFIPVSLLIAFSSKRKNRWINDFNI